MGEKKKDIGSGEEQKKGENKKTENDSANVVVLKTEFHCRGCASKVLKFIRSFDGVETVTMVEGEKITVIGKVDAATLREAVERKSHKRVELISPKPKNDADKGGKKKDETKDKNEKSDEKKSKEKEPAVTTAQLKVYLHCEGCIGKLRRAVVKAKGYHEMKIDRQKNLVTVTGAIDFEALVESLRKQLKKDVQIVKKEAEKAAGEQKKDVKKVEPPVIAYPYPYPHQNPSPYPLVYGSGLAGDPFQYSPYAVRAPQMFSDENPDACTVM